MSDAIIRRVEVVEHWMNGNGNPGAAAIIIETRNRVDRLEKETECQEKRLNELDILRAGEEKRIMDMFESVLRKRGRTIEGVLRALGPYAAALAAVISAYLSAGGGK